MFLYFLISCLSLATPYVYRFEAIIARTFLWMKVCKSLKLYLTWKLESYEHSGHLANSSASKDKYMKWLQKTAFYPHCKIDKLQEVIGSVLANRTRHAIIALMVLFYILHNMQVCCTCIFHATFTGKLSTHVDTFSNLVAILGLLTYLYQLPRLGRLHSHTIFPAEPTASLDNVSVPFLDVC